MGQFNVNYSHAGMFTFHLHITRLSQETKSNKCNQIEGLFQRGFRPKFFTKYCIGMTGFLSS